MLCYAIDEHKQGMHALLKDCQNCSVPVVKLREDIVKLVKMVFVKIVVLLQLCAFKVYVNSH